MLDVGEATPRVSTRSGLLGLDRLLCTCAIVLAGCLAAPALAGASPLGGGWSTPEPVVNTYVPLPSTITKVQFPNFTADGSRILAVANSTQWTGTQLVTFAEDGSDLQCLTCGVWTGPALGKPFAFPDGRRVLVRIGQQTGTTSAAAGVVECTPSVLNCETAALLPIVVPSAGDPNIVQLIREGRVSPDGRHMAFTQIRTTATGDIAVVPIVGTLVHEANDYTISNPRVVANCAGTERCELKNFTPDGTGVIISRYAGAAEAGNPDDYLVNLHTGLETRLTYYPDWDEDFAISPERYHGQQWFVVGSGRGTGLLQTVAQITRPSAIDTALLSLTLTTWALKSPQIAQPWINSVAGERNGEMGQPLDPTAVPSGWGSRPNYNWSPDGTAVVYWQTRLDNANTTRVVVSHLTHRTPTHRACALATPDPSRWAPALAGYVPPDSAPPASRRGRVSGTMDVELGSAPAGSGYQNSIRVTYTNFADTRGWVINGVESAYYDTPGQLGPAAEYSANLVLSGRHTGYLQATNVVINPGVSITGTITSELDGHSLSLGPLP